ncbi:uncharacterized protein LOC127852175 isoform X4 [Dreissena polymorpha]|uniref:uncharacterized protein LOC127852175 isoform X4 n=1 Tax=Dreissena polymorpha TaxID=45954 RepID=UPI002264FEDA|nr:uncharacterized protein LOC127852175 isoform X4 [Dreissena polymorpha]
MKMSDYIDIIRKPETQNWFKAAMGMNITRDCLLDIVKEITHELYNTIRKEINRKHGVPEIDVCSQCYTPNVLTCDTDNKCCHYKNGRCAFHDIYKPRNCSANLCNEICKEIVCRHRFRNRSKPKSFQGPTWVNTDASKWCAEPWQIAKCYLSKDGYKDVNKEEEADFNGIVNIMYNCEFFQMYFKDDLTQKENVCIKAKHVRQAVCHSSTMSMATDDSDRAIDTLMALLQSLKHCNHQAATKTAVEKLKQLKNGTLAITTEDVATTFQHLKDNLIEQIKEALEHERDKLVKEMVDALNENISKALETIQRKGDDVLKTVKTKEVDILETVQRKGEDVQETVQNTGDDVLETVKKKGEDVLETVQSTGDDVLETIQRKGDDVLKKIRRKENEVLNKKKNATKNSTLSEIQSWLVEQYRERCVVPVSMLDPDIDVPLERIYVPPSIKELKRGQDDRQGGSKTDKTSTMKSNVNSYKELLHRDGNPFNTIYIQGNPGCGKTTFATKLVLDWCKAHSENGASTKKIGTVTSRGKASNQTGFSDLDTLRDYTFLFFVSLRDYSGSMCNVSQMVEDAIKSNRLPWDDSVWEHKCIVLTDAADEWCHPEIPFPPPCDSACKCRKDRGMPLYLKRRNITNIITARPWKLANLSMSDTLTRMFEISGVTNYKTLAKNVIKVLTEKDGISKNDQQCKCIDFLKKIKAKGLHNLITIPAVCVQLVHQFYVGRLMEGSLCAIYINMLDMHIAKGLQKLQIKEFDTEATCFEKITQTFGTETTEYLRGNWSLVCSASVLAFKTLTDSNKESSLVFSENTITNHMTKTKLDYLLQTGIITKKKALALSSRKNVPYMFVHKTIQEFLASLYIAMNQTDIADILNVIQSVYCDADSILDIGQLFIFTCGMCAPAAERMSQHIMDVITCDFESKLHCMFEQATYIYATVSVAQGIVLDGFIERVANEQPCLQLTLSHVSLGNFKNEKINENDALKTLIDMNISNIISLYARLYDSAQEESYRVQEIISQSRETLSYLCLRGEFPFDLQGLKLKYLSCWQTDISNLDCTYMHACEIWANTLLSEERILQSMSVTGKNIRLLKLGYIAVPIDLLCSTLPNLTTLHTLILVQTNISDKQLYFLPESIRKVVYQYVKVSAQHIKSIVEWSKSRDACVSCELCPSYLYDEDEICQWIQRQDSIDISRRELEDNAIYISWSTILSN